MLCVYWLVLVVSVVLMWLCNVCRVWVGCVSLLVCGCNLFGLMWCMVLVIWGSVVRKFGEVGGILMVFFLCGIFGRFGNSIGVWFGVFGCLLLRFVKMFVIVLVLLFVLLLFLVVVIVGVGVGVVWGGLIGIGCRVMILVFLVVGSVGVVGCVGVVVFVGVLVFVGVGVLLVLMLLII